LETTITIDSVAHGGDGVGRVEGQVCFVPFALPGETVRVEITRKAKNLLRAKLLEVIEASPHRVKPACNHHGRCGACLWGHFGYPGQAEWKQRIVGEALARIAGVETDVAWVENADLRHGYRTRAEFHGDGKGFGFFAVGTHDVVDLQMHPSCCDSLNNNLQKLRELKPKGGVTVTVNPEGEEVLVWTKFARRSIKQRFPRANSAKEDTVGRSYFLFDGAPIVNGCFSQSSLPLNRLLVKAAQAAMGKPVSVLDCYCGNGNLSIALPERCEVVGMDHNRDATRAARKISERDYRKGDEEKMRALIGKDQWDVILLDPPRTGAKELMPALAASHARALVYVSCDPATLARDVKTLAAEGWKLTQCTAIDMFPNTPHVETVARLERG
jgi:23S rRNA (uracil1939-C5)-methyltransferase